MTDMQALFKVVDRLSPAEREELETYLTVPNPEKMDFDGSDKPIERKIKMLKDAFAEIREGLTPEELAEMTWAMNYEYKYPDALSMYDWIDDLPEDER